MSPKNHPVLHLSTRRIRRRGEEPWPFTTRFPQLEEARSIDSWINPCVDDCGNYAVTSLDELSGLLELLPKPVAGREYYLLFTDALAHPLPPDPRLRLLGHDLSDETWTSSLLNCGDWRGPLAPIAARAGRNGLLELEDARLAQQLLPLEWPGDPHGWVTVWALYEYLPDPDHAS